MLSLTQNLGIHIVPCREAWEINSRARTALLGKGLDSPQHLFGDLLSIFPGNVVAKMFRIQRRLSREHRRMVKARQVQHWANLEAHHMDLLLALDALLSGVVPQPKAWCFRHNRYCTVPVPPPGAFAFHCAGTTCVD